VRETYEYTVATVLKPEEEAILQNAQDFVKTVKKYLEKIGVLVGAMH
jgi:ABC-type Na+ transport system ATPase subunit NatA